MRATRYKPTILLPIIIMVLASACATAPRSPDTAKPAAYRAPAAETMLGRYAPLFLVENNPAAYNRIGTPRASVADDGKEMPLELLPYLICRDRGGHEYLHE